MPRLQDLLQTWIKIFLKRGPESESPQEGTLSLDTLPSLEEILKGPDALPPDCLRFFLPAPLEDEGLLLGRESEMERLKAALKAWEGGRPEAVALVGPQGAGKTSLANCLLGHYPGDWRILRSVIRKRLSTEESVLGFFNGLFDLDPPAADAGTLMERLVKAEPRIVLVESGHNALLRVLGSQKAAELFFYILLGTRGRHFWLLTFRDLAWGNMDRQLGIARCFSQVVRVEPLSEDTLQDALNLRIAGSGLKPFFYTSQEKSIQARKGPEEDNREGEQAFFKGVLANTGRNLFAALYFLLLCSRYDAQTSSMVLWAPEHLDLSFVKGMEKFILLSLAEIAGHGSLTRTEHERIFRTDGLRTGMIFGFLELAGLVGAVPGEHEESERPFEISPIVHHAVTTALEKINMIY
ncbi:MAG: ATP-binding protein [Proteobacteria bacterium]|nr:ATP-binding protein [Pseudomonadota bacterium]